MVISAVKHPCKQECYKPGDIAILTPYIGQLRLLRDKLEGIVDRVIGGQDLADLRESEGELDESNNNNYNRRSAEKGKLSNRT